VGGLIHLYTRAGDYVGTLNTVQGNSFSSLTKMMRVTRTGGPYLFTTLFLLEDGRPQRVRSRHVMIGLGSDGAARDTLDVPWYDLRVFQIPGAGLKPLVTVPYSPNKNWNMTYSGAMIGGASDAYSFAVRHPDGRVLRIERLAASVPVAEEEAAWHRDALTGQMRTVDPTWSWRGPAIPSHKPAFEAFIPDRGGRIWVLRLGPGLRNPDTGEWRDSYLLDVFEEQTGRYLGEVAVPPGVRFAPEPWISGDRLIAYRTDAEGTPLVTSYRLVVPGS
jgi:hypothetical protein